MLRNSSAPARASFSKAAAFISPIIAAISTKRRPKKRPPPRPLVAAKRSKQELPAVARANRRRRPPAVAGRPNQRPPRRQKNRRPLLPNEIMKGRSAAIAAILLCVACRSGFSIEPVALRSYSGQFFVRGLPLGAPLIASAPTSSVSYVRLDPTLLAVSCER